MGVLIDADILINAERGLLNLEAHTTDRQELFFLSVVTASEMLHGVYRTKDPAIRQRRTEFVESLLSKFTLLPIDDVIARTRGRITAQLAEQGQSIGSDDSWIAATCVALGHTLVTGNAREFNRVEGLAIETWRNS